MSENAWIEHDGKGCPVDRNAMVDVRFRDLAEEYRFSAEYWSENEIERDNWTADPLDHHNDIIAYRLSGPSA